MLANSLQAPPAKLESEHASQSWPQDTHSLAVRSFGAGQTLTTSLAACLVLLLALRRSVLESAPVPHSAVPANNFGTGRLRCSPTAEC